MEDDGWRARGRGDDGEEGERDVDEMERDGPTARAGGAQRRRGARGITGERERGRVPGLDGSKISPARQPARAWAKTHYAPERRWYARLCAFVSIQKLKEVATGRSASLSLSLSSPASSPQLPTIPWSSTRLQRVRVRVVQNWNAANQSQQTCMWPSDTEPLQNCAP